MKFTKIIITLLLFKSLYSIASPNDSNYIRDPFYIKLTKTNSQIPLFFNEQVKKQIGVYMRNTNNSTALLIGRTQYYYNLYATKFSNQAIPLQLFLISAVNSESNPTYIDEDGASGQWALGYPIAKKYNLTTNSYVDERRNPQKSSEAAALYFKDLNLIYMDWLKSLAAFRCGPINLNMAIHRANNSLDYNKIHLQLPPEFQKITENYMAFWYIWNYYAESKIVPIKYKLPDTDTVQVQKEISLSSIAFQLNIPEETLKQSNSELRIGIMPVSFNFAGLKLPKDKISEYHDKLLVLFPPPPVVAIDSTNKDSLLLFNNTIDKPRVVIEKDDAEDEHTTINNSKVTVNYTVKKGDGLLLIADLFDCRVSDIKKWNGMKKDAIYSGQKLKLQVPKKKLSEYKKINSMTASQKKKLAKRS
jgi:membrane-bound lytic murein transglycosylase D